MQRSAKDHSVFYRLSSAGTIFLVVYVDDIIVTGNDSIGITSLKLFLQSLFLTKDLGQLKFFLRVEVASCKRGIFLFQHKYALYLLRDTNMMGAKPSDTPMLPGVKLAPEKDAVFDNSEKYRRLGEKLNYLIITRPDIAFSVSVVSQFMSHPRTPHWKAALHILKYIKGHPNRGLLYSDHGHCRIKGFSDADWAGSPSDRRSTSGYCVFVGENLVSWKSRKQSAVARSSVESEYRALTYLTSIVTFLQ
ncbi:hypothetical protein Dimus_038946 [Dionaea muscipula]